MNTKHSLFFFFLLAFLYLELKADPLKPIIYLIPGQGADSRLFDSLELDERYELIPIKYELPEKHSSLQEYARQLSEQIDTNRRFILIGSSLGGMLATEMNDFMNPEKVIVIASAKCRQELPGRYRFQKKLPIYKLISGRFSKWGALRLQGLVEPDRNKEKATFVSMLKDKDPQFMKRTIAMIVNWKRTEYDPNILHIHGDKDHTIPIKNVSYDYLIKDGSHVMTLTRAAELSVLINELLEE